MRLAALRARHRPLSAGFNSASASGAAMIRQRDMRPTRAILYSNVRRRSGARGGGDSANAAAGLDQARDARSEVHWHPLEGRVALRPGLRWAGARSTPPRAVTIHTAVQSRSLRESRGSRERPIRRRDRRARAGALADVPMYRCTDRRTAFARRIVPPRRAGPAIAGGQ
jgi:hypothetical protein